MLQIYKNSRRGGSTGSGASKARAGVQRKWETKHPRLLPKDHKWIICGRQSQQEMIHPIYRWTMWFRRWEFFHCHRNLAFHRLRTIAVRVLVPRALRSPFNSTHHYFLYSSLPVSLLMWNICFYLQRFQVIFRTSLQICNPDSHQCSCRDMTCEVDWSQVVASLSY